MKMDELARLAHVSKTAVSLALNNRPGVSAATREKVLALAKKNNYVPAHRSRKMTTMPAIHFVSVMTTELGGTRPADLPFFASLLTQVSMVTQSHNATLQIDSLTPDQIQPWLNNIDEDSDHYFGTLLLATNLSQTNVLNFTRRLKKVLVLDADFKDLAINAVAIDNFLGGYRAADELVSRGYTDIGYIQANEQYPNFIERQNGFMKRLKDAGLTPQLIKKVPSMSLTQSSEDCELMRASLPRAIFCDNDYIAIRLIRAAQQAGVRIPEDIALMGFDDIAESRVIAPELTTVHVPIHTIAKVAVDRLNQLAANEYTQYTSKILLEPTMVIRHTI